MVRSRRTSPLCVVKGTKKKQKRPYETVRTGYGWPILLSNASLGNQIQASLVMVQLVESDD